MSVIGHLCWKELKAYFTSWLAYAVLAGWLFIAGYTWVVVLLSAAQGGYFLQPVYQNFMVMLVFITPLLTMRLLAEERREGTLEMLFTSPLTEWQVTLGKWIGALIFMLVLAALTIYIPLFSLRYGSIDVGPLWGGYFALICVSAAALAFGLFCSSLSDSQVVAGFLTFGGLLFSWMLSWLGAGAASPNVLLQLLGELSIYSHFSRMLGGAVDSADLIFFVTLTAFFLFATTRVLESRKWR